MRWTCRRAREYTECVDRRNNTVRIILGMKPGATSNYASNSAPTGTCRRRLQKPGPEGSPSTLSRPSSVLPASQAITVQNAQKRLQTQDIMLSTSDTHRYIAGITLATLPRRHNGPVSPPGDQCRPAAPTP